MFLKFLIYKKSPLSFFTFYFWHKNSDWSIIPKFGNVFSVSISRYPTAKMSSTTAWGFSIHFLTDSSSLKLSIYKRLSWKPDCRIGPETAIVFVSCWFCKPFKVLSPVQNLFFFHFILRLIDEVCCSAIAPLVLNKFGSAAGNLISKATGQKKTKESWIAFYLAYFESQKRKRFSIFYMVTFFAEDGKKVKRRPSLAAVDNFRLWYDSLSILFGENQFVINWCDSFFKRC